MFVSTVNLLSFAPLRRVFYTGVLPVPRTSVSSVRHTPGPVPESSASSVRPCRNTTFVYAPIRSNFCELCRTYIVLPVPGTRVNSVELPYLTQNFFKFCKTSIPTGTRNPQTIQNTILKIWSGKPRVFENLSNNHALPYEKPFLFFVPSRGCTMFFHFPNEPEFMTPRHVKRFAKILLGLIGTGQKSRSYVLKLSMLEATLQVNEFSAKKVNIHDVLKR